MKLSREQEEAVSRLNNFLGSGEPVFKLQGYAGTGKSTCISQVIDPEEAIFAAPTAKAATVLKRKGVDAQTLHSIMYQPFEYRHPVTGKPTLGFKLNPKCKLAEGGTIVVDEASMVPSQIAEDLLSFPVQVIAVGDPGQLPPVMSRGGGSLLHGHPDAMLTEVHRTALDSPVLALATWVRKNGRLPNGVVERDGTRVINDIREAGDLLSYDQVIVGRHRTRFKANAHMRSLKGYKEPLPQLGETILVKKNDREKGLVNGEQYKVRSTIPMDSETLLVRISDPEGRDIDTTMWTHGFMGKEGMDTLEEMRFKDRGTNTEAWHSEAITCHSSQGSEWDKILVVDESAVFGKNRGKWLYTAVTRASESVVVVRR